MSDIGLSAHSQDAYTLAIMQVENEQKQQQQQQQQQSNTEQPEVAVAETHRNTADGADNSNNSNNNDNSNNSNNNDIAVITNTPTLISAQANSTRLYRSDSGSAFGNDSLHSRGSSNGSQPNHRSSSIEIRRQPTPSLLMPVQEVDTDEDDTSSRDIERGAFLGGRRSSKSRSTNTNGSNGLFGSRVIQWACLNPRSTVRAQLMMSFGTVHILSTIIIIIICTISMAYTMGHNVKQINTDTFDKLATAVQGRSARYLAESLEERLYPTDIVEIIYQVTLDRMEGYNASDPEMTSSDKFVPFINMEDPDNSMYPIVGRRMPLDWESLDDPNLIVTAENEQEHVQDRRYWYGHSKEGDDPSNPIQNPPLSTAQAGLFIQGTCDPTVKDTLSAVYAPNCTAANNDLTTGGVNAPSPFTQHIHRKLQDTVPIIKSLYEFHQNLRDIGLYTVNDGAGATLIYPHYSVNAQSTYTSAGCEWLNAPHPYDSTRTIGKGPGYDLTKHCRPKNQSVKTRQHYNPLERAWYGDMALEPEKVHFHGPYLDAWTPDNWLISLGRAIYDRRTKDLVACVYVGMSILFLEQFMKDSRLTEQSELSVVRWDEEGTVVASSTWKVAEATETTVITKLPVGVKRPFYEKLLNLVSFDEVWDPESARTAYETTLTRSGGYVVSGYPVPSIPDVYDPNYRPQFLAIVSTAEDDVFGAVRRVNSQVDDNLEYITIFSLSAGGGSILLAIIIILLVARIITEPLNDMNETADGIVASFGEEQPSNNLKSEEFSDDTGADSSAFQPVQSKPTGSRLLCIPNTEITLVVKEFNKMVSCFSGSLMAHSDKNKITEARNRFFLREQFAELYRSRTSDDLKEVIPPGSQQQVANLEVSYEFVHKGQNANKDFAPKPIGAKPASSSDISAVAPNSAKRLQKRWRSPLFLWIVCLIVTPLLITTVTISSVVIRTASGEFQESVDQAREEFLVVEQAALQVYTKLRAEFVSSETSRSVRDLYLMTRYSGWLLFGGLGRTNMFPKVTSNLDCKDISPTLKECPLIDENRVCDCAWDQLGPPQCKVFDPPSASRYLQHPYFMLENDIESSYPNGTRLATSYPDEKFGTSPSDTKWYTDVNAVPGNEKGASASGYSTSYDRLRVLSAMPLFPPLQNYETRNKNGFAYFLTMEEDGLIVVDRGCENSEQSQSAFWKSTVDNDGATYRPKLCPIGKHGYDPRCREWYHAARTLALEDGGSHLYLSPPYIFITSEIALSATSPLMDPISNKHVGQVLIDFKADSTFDIMNSYNTPVSEGGIRLLFTPSTDLIPAQVVIGPGVSRADTGRSVQSVMMPEDLKCQETDTACKQRIDDFNREVFDKMDSGQASSATILRRNEDGHIDIVYISFAPVFVNDIKPKNPSEFGAGIELNPKKQIYALALAETQAGLLAPFAQAEKDLERQTMLITVVLSVAIFFSVIVVVYVSYVVTQSIIEPLLYLLDLIRCLNTHDTSHNPPKVDQNKGSKEIINVSNTMDTLYRVVKLANEAFYAGELGTAYKVLVDSLRVFRRLGNKKAIGVVCNNLGNTLLAIYREMKESKLDALYGLTRNELMQKGTSFFHDAIKVGEAAYDEFYIAEGWTPNCLDFMQHLANRYFNRGMFLLSIKDDHPEPDEIMELGKRDLTIAHDMDVEIFDQGEETGWGTMNRAEKLFNVSLVRIRGYLILLEMGYPDEGQTMDRLADIQELYAAEKQKQSQPDVTSDLFREISIVGRRQQIETELAKYHLLKGNSHLAAAIAIRMLFEDEYIFIDAQLQVVRMLQLYTESTTNVGGEYARIRISRKLEELNEALCHELQSERQFESSETMIALSSGALGLTSPSRQDSSRTTSDSSSAGRFDPRNQNLGNSLNSGSSHGGQRRSSKSNTRWSISERSGQFVTMERF